MLTYDLIVIGFGKAGKTLAGKLASAGKKVALVLAAAARSASVYKDERFSDHAPLVVDYDYSL